MYIVGLEFCLLRLELRYLTSLRNIVSYLRAGTNLLSIDINVFHKINFHIYFFPTNHFSSVPLVGEV
jgi:hypothetical protein